MSETAGTVASTPRSKFKILYILVPILILLILYGTGAIVLPILMQGNYRSGNCESVLTANRAYRRLYPGFMTDRRLAAPVGECQAYALAKSEEQKGNWQEAYEAYRSYASAYPAGLYAREVHKRSAVVLMAVAKGQVQQQKYEEAVASLNQLMSNYADTDTSAEAWTLFPTAYTSWGSSLRDAGEFEMAEQVLHEYLAWSQSNQKKESELQAQAELAKTYITWGQALQSQKEYEAALTKFDLAGSADPSADVKAGQRGVYIEWGNDLLAQKEFPAAIEKFKLAVSRSESDDDGAARALVNGYIQWADELSRADDFEAALDQMELAKQAAVTEDTKQTAEKALSEVYLAFSNSSGPQAKRAMREAVIAMCKKHDTPKLPIFGLDPEEVRYGIYGIDALLPENVTARTPGEMHYIACVDLERRTLEQKFATQPLNPYLKLTPKGFTILSRPLQRVQLFWDISLRKTDTGVEAAATSIAGGTPPGLPSASAPAEQIGNGVFEGTPPGMDELVAWLQSVIK